MQLILTTAFRYGDRWEVQASPAAASGPSRPGTVYLETSALLAWLLGEPGGDGAKLSVDAARRVVTSVLTVTEALRALLRAEQLGRLTEAERLALRGMLERARLQWTMMEVTSGVRARAGEPFPVEPVRTLDALHLSTALAFRRAFPDLGVVSLDQRILGNAVALGF